MFFGTDGVANKPTWVKLSIQKMVDFFEIENVEELEELIEDDPKLLSEMGKVLFNVMLYAYDRENDCLDFEYRDMRSLFRIIRQDIDISYVNYFKRVENGKKGGRPKEETEE